VSNAVKFTDGGGRIEVILSTHGSNARIEVRDTGQGIDPQFLPHVWERFRQGDSTASRQHGGLGLGLALVRYLTEMHGGTVRADSAGLGKGSTFTVDIPLPAKSLASAGDKGAADAHALQGRHILVVDDDQDARNVIASMLRLFGASVTAAASTDEALRVEADYDGVVTDLAMPGEDGYALLRRFRSNDRWQSVPVVALSAMGGTESRHRAMSAGFDEFLEKPIEAEVLATTVKRMVSAAHQR
jgi:CheY-like chemotaxis protein